MDTLKARESRKLSDQEHQRGLASLLTEDIFADPAIASLAKRALEKLAHNDADIAISTVKQQLLLLGLLYAQKVDSETPRRARGRPRTTGESEGDKKFLDIVERIATKLDCSVPSILPDLVRIAERETPGKFFANGDRTTNVKRLTDVSKRRHQQYLALIEASLGPRVNGSSSSGGNGPLPWWIEMKP